MKKQEYKKPEISVVEMDSCTILAGSGVAEDGSSVDLGGDFETDGDAGIARSPKSYDIWE